MKDTLFLSLCASAVCLLFMIVFVCCLCAYRSRDKVDFTSEDSSDEKELDTERKTEIGGVQATEGNTENPFVDDKRRTDVTAINGKTPLEQL